jgi:hypothetical protein
VAKHDGPKIYHSSSEIELIGIDSIQNECGELPLTIFTDLNPPFATQAIFEYQTYALSMNMNLALNVKPILSLINACQDLRNQ